MKKIFLYMGVVFVLLLQGCVMKNENEKVEAKTLLNDIWVLKKIDNEAIEKMRKQISLQFDVKANKVYGNDGCNQISGNIKKLTNDELVFGPIRKTMKACINMEIPHKYGKYLEKVKSYKIDSLKLYLLDENNKTLLEYLKAD